LEEDSSFTPLQVRENIEGHLFSSHSTFRPVGLDLAQYRRINSRRERPTASERALHLANRHSPTPVQQRHLDLNLIAGVSLLLLLFGKKIENCLSDRFLGHALKKTAVALNVLASDEPVHVGLHS